MYVYNVSTGQVEQPCTLHNDNRLLLTERAVRTRLTDLRQKNLKMNPVLKSTYSHIFDDFDISWSISGAEPTEA